MVERETYRCVGRCRVRASVYMCDARQIKMHSAPRLFSIRGAAADEKKIIMHAAADWNLG